MEHPQFTKCEPKWQPDTSESSKEVDRKEMDAEPNLNFPRQLVEHQTLEVKEEVLSKETDISKPLSSRVDISSLSVPGNAPAARSILNCVTPFKITKKDRSHSCATCGKTFSRLEDVKRHSLMHVGERSLSCSTCGKAFSRLDQLKRHELLHVSETSNQCATCGKTPVLSVVHLQGKKYCCTVCGEHFKHESSLKRHTLHPCGKAYVKKHQGVHNKKEPHVCRTCGQMFMRLSHFTRHRLLHKSDASRLDL